MALAEDRPSPTPGFCMNGIFQSVVTPQLPLWLSVFTTTLIASHMALQSVSAQTMQALELIVVDDASTDCGSLVVERWIQDCLNTGCHPFVRILLLRHENNAGLPPRNTAFEYSQAAWSFVLDADNLLFPDAVSACLALADSGDPQLAVVHPLLGVESEKGRPDDQRTLVSSAPWQRDRLMTGNVVDAMALVRRSAWETVGGYTHIQGGWEDTTLVQAHGGFHGIQCPQILALYRSHDQSMSHRATNQSWYSFPALSSNATSWLQLPLARSEDT